MCAHLHFPLSSKPSYGSSSVVPDLFSVVKQEKPEKAGQNSEHGAENSKPEWEVPARGRDEIGFCLGHDPGFLVLVACHSWQPQSAQRVRVKISGHAQALVTLITHDSAPGFR